MISRLAGMFVAILLAVSGYGQTPTYAFRIYFKDKSGTPFHLDQPEAFLSEKAISRRQAFGIAVDSSDLPVNPQYVDSVLDEMPGELHTVSRWHNAIVVRTEDSATVANLNNFTFVDSFCLVAYYPSGSKHAGPVPDENPILEKPTTIDSQFYGAAWDQIHLCRGAYLHDKGLLGEGMLIALIDAGFEGVATASAFDSLHDGGHLADRWNFVSGAVSTPGEGAHGTMTLSCMAAYLPDVYVGVAPEAQYALYTSEDLSSEQPIEMDNWTAAAERADSLGTVIISTSLGYNTFDPPFADLNETDISGHTTYIAQSVNQAASRGILMVVSAGNEGNHPWKYILTPGDADSAFTVGAVTMSKQPTPFTGRGPNASGALKPDVAALGSPVAVINAGGNVTYSIGTSLATPVIAGLAACLWQQMPEKHPREIRDLIRSVSHQYAQPDTLIGYGVPDFSLAYDVLSIADAVPTSDNKGSSTLQVFPNPARSSLTVQTQGAKIARVTIFETGGKCLHAFQTRPGTEVTLHISDLVPGNYLIWIQTTEGKWIGGKFVKR